MQHEEESEVGPNLPLTRNLLLRIPRHSDMYADRLNCNLGEGCRNSCSGQGFCYAPNTHRYCMCDPEYWGVDCATRAFGKHCDQDEDFSPYTLTNANQGWCSFLLCAYLRIVLC